jgi:hypothetical protein
MFLRRDMLATTPMFCVLSAGGVHCRLTHALCGHAARDPVGKPAEVSQSFKPAPGYRRDRVPGSSHYSSPHGAEHLALIGLSRLLETGFRRMGSSCKITYKNYTKL